MLFRSIFPIKKNDFNLGGYPIFRPSKNDDLTVSFQKCRSGFSRTSYAFPNEMIYCNSLYEETNDDCMSVTKLTFLRTKYRVWYVVYHYMCECVYSSDLTV